MTGDERPLSKAEERQAEDSILEQARILDAAGYWQSPLQALLHTVAEHTSHDAMVSCIEGIAPGGLDPIAYNRGMKNGAWAVVRHLDGIRQAAEVIVGKRAGDNDAEEQLREMSLGGGTLS